MVGVLTFPPVTDQLLVEVVRRILTIDSPIKIVLFGPMPRAPLARTAIWIC
jgi:hypothetical protein